jgi:hypothetical protein
MNSACDEFRRIKVGPGSSLLQLNIRLRVASVFALRASDFAFSYDGKSRPDKSPRQNPTAFLKSRGVSCSKSGV